MMPTPMADIETRMGIQPLEELHAERDVLVKQVAPLKVKWGPGGLGQHLRKAELSMVEETIRGKAAVEERKITEAAIEQGGHADPRYVEWLTTAAAEFAEMILLENEIDKINEKIIRGGQAGKYATSELHL